MNNDRAIKNPLLINIFGTTIAHELREFSTTFITWIHCNKYTNCRNVAIPLHAFKIEQPHAPVYYVIKNNNIVEHMAGIISCHTMMIHFGDS